MKKIMPFITKTLIVMSVAVIMLLVFLRVAFPPEKIKSIAENYARTEFGREVSFGGISFRIIGVTLHDFSLSEPGGFKNGTFAKTNRISFKVKLIPLLKKNFYISHVEADELFVDIIKKDGKYNFQAEASTESPKPAISDNEKSEKIFFVVSDAVIKKSQLQYFDKDSNRLYTVSGVFCAVTNLQLNTPFDIKLKFKFSCNKDGKNIEIPVDTMLVADFKNLNLAKAYLEAKYINLKYNDAAISIKGKVENFLTPYVFFSAGCDVFTNNTLKDIAKAAPFVFNGLKIDSAFKADYENKTFTFDSLNITSGKSMVKSSGKIDGAGFGFKSAMSLDIAEVLKSFGASSEKISFGGSLSAKTDIGKGGIDCEAWSGDLSLALNNPDIKIPEFGGKSSFYVDFSSDVIKFKSIGLTVMNSTFTGSGIYDTKRKSYAFAAESSLNIKDVASIFEKYVKEYSPEGFADISFTVSDAGVKGNALIKDAKARLLSVFEFGELRGRVDFNSSYDIKVSSLAGVLNGERFSASGSYLKDLQNITVMANADIPKIYLPELPPEYVKSEPSVITDSGSVKSGDIPKVFNLKINLSAGSAEFPQLHSGKFSAAADLKNITENYDKIEGSLLFKSDKVVIENLEKLINANSYTKSAFYALGMTYKTTEEMGVKVFEESEAADKKAVGLKFREVDGKAEFVPGIMSIRKLKLSSSYSSINAAGDIGLQDKTLNVRLTVNPMLAKAFVIKLGGTLDKPKASLDLVGSAFTIFDTLQEAGSSIYEAVKPAKEKK